VSLRNDFVEVFGLGGVERSQRKIIDDQQVRFYKSFDSFLPGMIGPSGQKTSQNFGCLDKEDAISFATGLLTQGLSEVGFSYACWAINNDMFFFCKVEARKRFVKEQQASLERQEEVLGDLRHGLYLGSEDFAEECLRRTEAEEDREKPQARMLKGERDVKSVAMKILGQLGEKNASEIFLPRKKNCPHRDIAIEGLYRLGVYRNADVGQAFGVGYTAIVGAAKRGREYLGQNPEVKRRLKGLLLMSP
jgi:hypothetical protein